MRIDRVEIKGFGKYEDFSLDLGKGLQVLYGQNEAGKTTLQNFIVSMLFGMKKPGKKRTMYHENHARYQPWEGKYYGGKLYLTIDDISYTIERNFIKNRDECKIFRTDSGEDVTNQFPEDNRKERQFLQTLLGVDELMFKNALCLGDHLRSEWEEWRSETAPKLVSGSHLQTADQALIQKAEAVLKQKMDEIGTERAESKLLGQAAAKRKKLQEDLRKTEEQEQSISQLCAELDEQIEVCEQKQIEWNLQKQRAAGRIVQLRESLMAEKMSLQSGIDGAEQAAASVEVMSEESYQQLRANVYRQLESYRSAQQERFNYSARIGEIRQIDPESADITERYQSVTEQELQQLDEIEQQLLAESRQLPDFNTDKRAGASDMRGVGGWHRPFVIAGIVAVLLGLAGFLINWKIGIALLAVGSVFTVISRSKGKQAARESVRMQEQERAAMRAQTEQLENQLRVILQRFDADTPRQARSRWQQILQSRERVASCHQQISWLDGELTKAESKLRQAWDTLQQLCGSSEPWNDQPSESADSLVQEWEAKAMQQLQQKKAEEQIKRLEADIVHWSAVVDELGVEPLNAGDNEPVLSREQLEAELRAVSQLERVYQAEKAKQTELSVKVQTLRQGRRGMAELAREYEAWGAEESRLAKMKQALETAASAFEEVRQVMYREQAPVLVQKVTELAQQFTAGRYQQLKVDNQMQIRLTSPDSGYTFEMDGLSKGTWDQMNFALALAVSESVVQDGDKLPLLIDEPFVHYDDQRMENTLQYLLKLAGMRQILFFTHRQHDVETLQKLGGEGLLVHNLIR